MERTRYVSTWLWFKATVPKQLSMQHTPQPATGKPPCSIQPSGAGGSLPRQYVAPYAEVLHEARLVEKVKPQSAQWAAPRHFGKLKGVKVPAICRGQDALNLCMCHRTPQHMHMLQF